MVFSPTPRRSLVFPVRSLSPALSLNLSCSLFSPSLLHLSPSDARFLSPSDARSLSRSSFLCHYPCSSSLPLCLFFSSSPSLSLTLNSHFHTFHSPLHSLHSPLVHPLSNLHTSLSSPHFLLSSPLSTLLSPPLYSLISPFSTLHSPLSSRSPPHTPKPSLLLLPTSHFHSLQKIIMITLVFYSPSIVVFTKKKNCFPLLSWSHPLFLLLQLQNGGTRRHR